MSLTSEAESSRGRDRPVVASIVPLRVALGGITEHETRWEVAKWLSKKEDASETGG